MALCGESSCRRTTLQGLTDAGFGVFLCFMTRRERLGELRAALIAVGDRLAWSDWGKIAAWGASARPFIVQSFPAGVARFDVLVAEPRWVQLCLHGISPVPNEGAWRAHQRVEQWENARLVSSKRAWILEFLDELARLDDAGAPDCTGANGH
jgi:hypothetical protein